ncbi:MAG: Ig-like domain-containing protein [Hydrogenoanaerobacterium sp.]
MQHRLSPGADENNIVLRRSKKQNLFQRFLENYIPNKNDTKRDLIRKIILLVAVFVLIGSVVYISSYFGESKSNKDKNANLQSIWEQVAQGGDVDEDKIEVDGEYPKNFLKRFYPLYTQNPDVRGWVKIDDTQVNYPVMQTENNTDYDRTDFEKKKNNHGIPFADYRVNLKKPSTNTIIYGHNMTDGQMFGELLNYKNLSYYKKHPLISFDSVYSEGQYKIAGIVVCKANDDEFLYHNFIDSDKNSAKMNMEQFVAKMRERSLINTTVDIKPTDKLITLSTCDYSFKDPVTNERIARFIVIGRKVRKGEDTSVDTDNAKLNPNPLMPKEWAQYLKKEQATELKAQQDAEATKEFGPIREEAKKWFTTEELKNIKDESLEVEIARRKETMKQYLNESELSNLTAEQKVALLKERQSGVDIFEEARSAIFDNPDLAFMTDSEINIFAEELAKVNKSKWPEIMKKRTVASEVELSIAPTSIKIMKGDTKSIDAFTNGGSGSVKWQSDDKAVASVDDNGLLTAKKAGSAVITASYSGRTATCKVTVTNDEVIETTISMPSNETVFVGSTIFITPSIYPDNMAERGVKWSITSGKSYIEIVDSTINDITILGLTEGKTAKVTATTRDGVTATCTVAIKGEDAKVSISPSSATLELGQTTTFIISNEKGKTKWTIKGNAATIASSDNVSCTVEATAEGKATVTATIADGQSVKAEITVKKAAEILPDVTISPSSLSLKVGDGNTLTLSGDKVKAKSWRSSNDGVVNVSGDETSASVVAVSEGTATITASLSNGKTATCKITVKAATTPPEPPKPPKPSDPSSSTPPPKPSEPSSSTPEPPKPSEPSSSTPEPPKPSEPSSSTPEPPKPSEPSSSTPEPPKPSESSSSTPEPPKPSESSSTPPAPPEPPPPPPTGTIN